MKLNLDIKPNEERGRAFIANLSITNSTAEQVELVAIIPNAAEGVEIVPASSEVYQDDVSEFRKLCNDLELIANGQLLERINEHRISVTNALIKQVKETFKIKSMIDIYIKMFIGIMSRKVNSSYFMTPTQLLKQSSLSLPIYSVEQAERVRDLAFQEKDFSLKVFDEKLSRLKKLENSGKTYGNSASTRELFPTGNYQKRYVIKCPRSVFVRSSSTVGFLCEFIDEKGDRFSKEVTNSMTVSANPIVLSFIAAVMAILANLVEVGEKKDIIPANSDKTIFDMFLSSFSGSGNLLENILGPALVAYVFFNFYENLEFSKNVPKTYSWRTAMFIGFVTGLLYEKVIAALGAFVG